MSVYNDVVFDGSHGELNNEKIKEIFNDLDNELKVPAGVNNYDQFNQGRYNFLHPHRGVVLMIYNAVLDGKPDSKNESDIVLPADRKRMKDVLSRSPFNYKHFISFKNVVTEQMELIFDCASKLEGLKNCSSFIFCFSGHGYMKSSECPDQDDQEFINDCKGMLFDIAKISHYFSDNKCEGLQGKPKIFFIDSCRSTNDPNEVLLDEGVSAVINSESVPETKPDSSIPSQSRRFKSGSKPGNQPVDYFKILCPTNFLLVNSCVKYQTADPTGLISKGMEEAYSDYENYKEIDFLEFITFASMKIAFGSETLEESYSKCFINTYRLLPIQHRLLAGVVYKATNTN